MTLKLVTLQILTFVLLSKDVAIGSVEEHQTIAQDDDKALCHAILWRDPFQRKDRATRREILGFTMTVGDSFLLPDLDDPIWDASWSGTSGEAVSLVT